MENQADKSSVFIITGMHRSGTSLTSSLMESAGINIGERLIGPSVGNTKGHFENSDFVQFHERVLRSQGFSQEGWTLKQSIPDSHQVQEEATLIIAQNSMSPIWGWKDPRTTLFLDFWNNLLPQAYFIFTYRAPWEVVDSLYRRGDKIFSNNPKYALEIWIHYNKLILDFYRRFPSKSILLNIETLIADCNCISNLCRDKFGIKLGRPTENILDKSLMSTLESTSYRPLLIHKLFPEAVDIFNTLNSQSDVEYKSSIFENVGSDESFRDWIFQDWFNSRQSKLKLTQLEQTQLELTQLEQTQLELDRSQLQLQQVQFELGRSQLQLQQTQLKLDRSLSNLESNISAIKLMKTSKFWKAKEAWSRVKKMTGFSPNN